MIRLNLWLEEIQSSYIIRTTITNHPQMIKFRNGSIRTWFGTLWPFHGCFCCIPRILMSNESSWIVKNEKFGSNFPNSKNALEVNTYEVQEPSTKCLQVGQLLQSRQKDPLVQWTDAFTECLSTFCYNGNSWGVFAHPDFFLGYKTDPTYSSFWYILEKPFRTWYDLNLCSMQDLGTFNALHGTCTKMRYLCKMIT